ncbi:hypothetical protein [Rhizobium sp. FY34]|uniref:hypothetical protein n=1 Tax=Rhizobium sp. FY34 TaxID=2562309 RepID=UPI0010C0A86C|nr:hypothetical protein [Rhizobium sp. FY34]
MCTTDQADQSPSDQAQRNTRNQVTLGMRWLSLVVRGLTRRRTGNSIRDLSDYQMQDIGLDDGHPTVHEAISRSARQEARLRQAHQDALYLAIGMRGR